MYTRLLAHSYTRGILRKHCELVIYFSIPTRNRHLIIFTLYGTGGFQKRRANIPHKRFLQAIYLWPAIPPGAARRHKPKTSRPLANWRYKPGYGAEWHWAPTCQYEYSTRLTASSSALVQNLSRFSPDIGQPDPFRTGTIHRVCNDPYEVRVLQV